MKTESQTRKDLIDTKLFSAGWDVNNLVQVSQELDMPIPHIQVWQHQEHLMKVIGSRCFRIEKNNISN